LSWKRENKCQRSTYLRDQVREDIRPFRTEGGNFAAKREDPRTGEEVLPRGRMSLSFGT